MMTTKKALITLGVVLAVAIIAFVTVGGGKGLGATLLELQINDKCPNIAGLQLQIPGGYTKDASGNCIPCNNYTFVTKWGKYGTGVGDFNDPQGIAVDAASNIFVMDVGNNRVQKFNSNGAPLVQWPIAANFAYTNAQGITTDTVGNVYLVESKNNRVLKFSSTGTPIATFGWGVKTGASQFEVCTSNCQVGIVGGGNGQFDGPMGVAVDTAGNIYVVDVGSSSTSGNRVQKFSSSYNYLAQWGGWGSGNNQFLNAVAIALDASNNVYVTDLFGARVSKFTSNGVFISMFGWGVKTGVNQFEICNAGQTCQVGIPGSGTGQFSYHLHGVSVDTNGNVYVADSNNNRIQKFTSTGTFIVTFGWGVKTGANQFEVCTVNCRVGIAGSGDGQFFGPVGVAADSLGNVYVSEGGGVGNQYGNNRIQKFSPNCKIASAIQIAPISTTLPITTKDYCPNIDGIQPSIPEGYMVDASGNCVRKLITPTTLQNTSLLTASSTTNIATILPDIIVSDFTWKPFTSNPGNYLYLSVTIKNIGTGSAFFPEGTTFTVYKDTITSGNWSGALTIGNGTFTLAPGETKTLDIITMQNSVLTAQRGMFNIIVKADDNSSWLNLVPGAGVAESNENNNSVTKQITIQ